jgi:hypothetical protein
VAVLTLRTGGEWPSPGQAQATEIALAVDRS